MVSGTKGRAFESRRGYHSTLSEYKMYREGLSNYGMIFLLVARGSGPTRGTGDEEGVLYDVVRFVRYNEPALMRAGALRTAPACFSRN